MDEQFVIFMLVGRRYFFFVCIFISGEEFIMVLILIVGLLEM